MNSKAIAAIAVIIIIIAAAGAYVALGGSGGDDGERTVGTYSAPECNLWIYGNANGDNYIDQEDINLLEGIIAGTSEEVYVTVYDGYNASNDVARVSFADANQDGRVDEADVQKVRDIIAYQQAYSAAVSNGMLASFNDEITLYYNNCDNITASVHLPIKTLVSMYFSNSEIVRLLGAADRVVATDSTTVQKPTLLPEFKDLPNLGDRKNTNSEAILATGADAYFTGSASTYSPHLEEQIGEQVDIIRLSAWEDNNVMVGALTLGYMLGATEKAYEYIDWCFKYIDMVGEKVSGIADEDKVSVIVPKGRDSCLEGNGAGSGQYEITLLAGADNLAYGMTASSEYPDFTSEDMLNRGVECIILSGYCGFEYTEADIQAKVLDVIDAAKQTYYGTPAVENGKVYFIANEIFTGPSNIVSMVYCAEWLYPELFPDLDGDAVFQEYIDLFCPSLADYDLDAHIGQFVYGPLV